jgi:hypothetical protein
LMCHYAKEMGISQYQCLIVDFSDFFHLSNKSFD